MEDSYNSEALIEEATAIDGDKASSVKVCARMSIFSDFHPVSALIDGAFGANFLTIRCQGYHIHGALTTMQCTWPQQRNRGSAEGCTTAEPFIATASKRCTWMMLKNCHLCTDWLAGIHPC